MGLGRYRVKTEQTGACVFSCPIGEQKLGQMRSRLWFYFHKRKNSFLFVFCCFLYVADLQYGSGTRVGAILNRSEMGVGVVFPGTGFLFLLWSGTGAGYDFYCGSGTGLKLRWNENPLPCHPLISSSMVLFQKNRIAALASSLLRLHDKQQNYVSFNSWKICKFSGCSRH